MSTVIVTGGTGTLGRHVVGSLLAGGHDVRVTSRRPAVAAEEFTRVRVDYRDATAVMAAFDGADAVVHCATSLGGREAALAGVVAEAARRVGCRQLVYISIVGADRVPFPYYRTKVAAERRIIDSGVPWTVLRATQFHDLVLRVVSVLERPPVLLCPDVPVQPVDAAEVGRRLAELAVAEPAGRVPDFGGPEVARFADLARACLSAHGRRRRVVPVRLPGAVFRAYHDGGHLAPEHATGRTTFAEFLGG